MSKLKVIIAIFISSFIGIISNPEMMAASDHVSVNSLNADRAVETVVIEPDVSEESYVVETGQTTDEIADETFDEPAPEEVYNEVYTPENYIQIAGRTVELGFTDSLRENAGDAVYGWIYGNGNFIYAHNYYYVFGVLDNAYDEGWAVGLQFGVTINGATRYYTVNDAAVYTFNQASARMNGIVNGGGHALAIMTCYGDNSRLVLYAD